MKTVLTTEQTSSVSDAQERTRRIRQQAEQGRQRWQDDQVADDDRVAVELADKGFVLSPETVSRLTAEGDWDTLLESLHAMKERVGFIESQLRDRTLFFGPPTAKRFVWTIAEGLQRRG